MPIWKPRNWPSKDMDVRLLRTCHDYRKAFDNDGDGRGRPLLTRLNADSADMNVLILMLPDGKDCQEMLDILEPAVADWVSKQCDLEGVSYVERQYER